MRLMTVVFTNLLLCMFILSGCTLLEVKSTKTEQKQPESAPVVEKKDEGLETRVMELEQRVKVLEDKLQGRW